MVFDWKMKFVLDEEERKMDLDYIAMELKESIKEEMGDNTIIDVYKFKRELRQQNLMTDELEEFIENYMRFDNVWE